MMGRQHALAGLLAGVGIAACIPSAPWPVRGLAVIVCGGAGLLPDLDHPRTTPARSLGLLTKLIATGVERAAVSVYHATRVAGDPASRAEGGHRALTHTVPWSVLAGVLAGLLCMLGPVAAAAGCALLGGLLPLGSRVSATVSSVASGTVSWWVLSAYPGWWPVVPAAVTVGCLVHVAGDAVTAPGAPALWPLVIDGQRWRPVALPVTCTAGDHIERSLITPILLVALVVAVASATGALGVLVSVAVAAGGS